MRARAIIRFGRAMASVFRCLPNAELDRRVRRLCETGNCLQKYSVEADDHVEFGACSPVSRIGSFVPTSLVARHRVDAPLADELRQRPVRTPPCFRPKSTPGAFAALERSRLGGWVCSYLAKMVTDMFARVKRPPGRPFKLCGRSADFLIATEHFGNAARRG